MGVLATLSDMPKWTDNPKPNTLKVRAWRLANREKQLAQQRRYYSNPENRARNAQLTRAWVNKRRLEMIAEMGGACVCCGETEPRFLQFDHINNDGHVDRKTAGRSIYYKRPIQLLCANCNAAKRFGICPHQEQKAKIA